MQTCVKPSFYEIVTHRRTVTSCGSSGCGGGTWRHPVIHTGCGSSGCGALVHKPITACGGGGTGGCGGSYYVQPDEYIGCGAFRHVSTCG